MSEVTVSPLPDRLRDRVAPTRASPLARRQARTRTARGVRRLASARTADAPLDREPGGGLRGSGSSSTIFTGTRWTILTKLPVA
ncbi:hypothetical protein QZN29_11960, partial [Burkholderia multivorans]|nr:hypothetical protein [Burkholderia multivorans]